jgi:hypothetical protein
MTLVTDVAPPVERPRQRHLRVWIAVILVVALLGAGIPTASWFAHRRSHLHSLVDYPLWGAGQPIAVGTTMYFGANTWPADAQGEPGNATLLMHVSTVRPVILQNSSAAHITVLDCVRKRLGDDAPGVLVGDVHSHCATLALFASGSLRIGDRIGDDDLIIAITPSRTGRVRIAGLRLSYSSGHRHGTQHVGAQIVAPTSE